ncbi:MAG: F420-0--gamma-glutamyl ligase [Candidatus Binatia bacterium]|nr:MAG: F420-0--gamma-glutamyl ligase [Candidatus Binatia bacterium]
MKELRLFPLSGLPPVVPGTDLGGLLLDALDRSGIEPEDGDIVVVCQKVVSKAEGRVVRLAEVEPSEFARILAREIGKDARILEVVLRETRRVVRMDRGHLIVETHHGWVCANAGVDESNAPESGSVVLLPEDADESARRIRDRVREASGKKVAVVVTDTFGRPWREGLVEFAIGVAGIAPLLDLRRRRDFTGRPLEHTVVAQVDAIAAAAGLLMRKDAGIPAVLLRGYEFRPAEESARRLVRRAEEDLFR